MATMPIPPSLQGELLALLDYPSEGDVDHVVTAFGQDNEPEGLPT